MLFFEYLKTLDKHLTFLKNRIHDSHQLFLVGGCIRDLLLGIEKNPTDIDFTMSGDPKNLDKMIDKKGISYFITEKFGTMTLIKDPMKYELTPLRTEGKYDDYRHPREIERSNDVLLDSNRRDFTINCIYYTNTQRKSEYEKHITKKNIHNYTDDDMFIQKLNDQGYLLIKDINILVLQDHKHISKLFKDGLFHEDHLMEMLKSVTIFTSNFTSKRKKKNVKLNTKHLPLKIVVDPHKGIQDCIKKRLRTVGEADKRFNEDALRIIRAIRFVNVLNQKLTNVAKKKAQLFDFIKETRASIKKNHALVKNVAKERIKEEIMKAFTDGNPFGFIALLDEAKLLKHLFPALYETKHIEQPVRFHPFDVYTHTLLTLFELQKINKDPLVRLAMLYHDVGKVEQFKAYKDELRKEEIRKILAGPLNHRRSSPEYAKRDFKALGFSSKEITEIARYIANHHKPEEMLMTKEENTEKKVRMFFSDAGYKRAMNIMDITMADRLGQYNPLQNSSDISDVEKLKTILKKLHKNEGQFTMKDLAVDGSDIMKQFKLKPGPAIGQLLKKTLARVMNDIKKRNTKKEIFSFLGTQIKHIKTNE